MIKVEKILDLAGKAGVSVSKPEEIEKILNILNSSVEENLKTAEIVSILLKKEPFSKRNKFLAVCFFYYLCKPIRKDKETLYTDMEEISGNNYTIKEIADLLFKRGNVGSLRIKRLKESILVF